MNTPAANPQESFELKLRTLRTLWIALFSSIGFYYALTIFVGLREETDSNPMVSLVLAVVALSTILASFLLKSKLLTRAAEQQQVQLVQQAYILAWALTEAAAIFGLLDFFVTGHRHYYILFIIAVIGFLVNAPRRDHLINAWPKTPI